LGGGGLEVGLDDYTDGLATDPLRRSIMEKVTVVADKECTEIFPWQFPATLTVTLTNGQTVVEKAHANRGGNLNPLSFGDLSKKFQDNVQRVMNKDASEKLAESCRSLEELDNLNTLLSNV